MLIRNRELGRALAVVLNDQAGLLMHSHGSTVFGSTVRQVVLRGLYTESNPRMEREALRLGDVTFPNEQEAANAMSTSAG